MSLSRAVLLLCAAPLMRSAAGQRTTAGELAHYSFRYKDCINGAVPSTVAPSATTALSLGTQHQCMDGHLGLSVTYPCATDSQIWGGFDGAGACPANGRSQSNYCAYAPAVSGSGGGLLDRLDGSGFTLEAWIKPAAMAVTARDGRRVIAALSARCPTYKGGAPLYLIDEEYCADSEGPVSMKLMQRNDRCLSVELRLGNGVCLELPPKDQACGASQALTDPATLATVAQHVVVTINNTITDSTTSVPSRFAIYIDGVAVVDSERLSDAVSAKVRACPSPATRQVALALGARGKRGGAAPAWLARLPPAPQPAWGAHTSTWTHAALLAGPP